MEDETLTASSELRIFRVPESLRNLKTEAYAPRLIGLGPFHHFRPRLYKMEAHKLAVAKRGLQRFNVPDLPALVGEIIPLIPRIRACYNAGSGGGGHGLSPEALALVTAVDGLFFSELIRGDDADLPGLCKPPATGGHYLFEYLNLRFTPVGKIIADIFRSFGRPLPFDPRAAAGRKPPLHSIAINDIVLLENQIPIWIVGEALAKFRPDAGSLLARDLDSFCRLVSPLALPEPGNGSIDGLHLLEYLYLKITGGEVEQDGAVARIPVDQDLDIRREILQNLPDCLWVGKSREGSETKSRNDLPNHSSLPAMIWATIPSATDLRGIGLKFRGRTGDLRIEFDEGNRTITIPTFRWSPYSEVVLRNLVVYEAMAKPSASSGNNSNADNVLLLIQYIHFMHMIIRQPSDVRFLMETGVIEPSDEATVRILGLFVSLCTCYSSDDNTLLDDDLKVALNKHCSTVYRAVRSYYCARPCVAVRGFSQRFAFSSVLGLVFLFTLTASLNSFAGGLCQFIKFLTGRGSGGGGSNCVASNIAMFVNGSDTGSMDASGLF